MSWTVRGGTLLRVTVQVMAESRATGARSDHEGRLSATESVDAVIADARVAARQLISGCWCRTASHALVPLGSEPGFDLGRGGRLRGTYDRPPFTGCGWITPLVNLVAATSANPIVIDLLPVDRR